MTPFEGLSGRTKILIRRFYTCSLGVKRTLFKAYFICLYGTDLSCNYNIGSLRKLSSCNKCVKLFSDISNTSVTRMLFEIGIPSFDTIMHNNLLSFTQCWNC